MRKRVLSFICAVIMLLATAACMTTGVLAVPQEYWAIQAEYNTAVQKNDENGIVSAAEKLTKLFARPADASEYNMLAWPLQKAAAIYEKRGQFSKATETYKKFLECVEYLNKNGYDYYDLIKSTKAFICHDSLKPAVYAATTDTVSYFGAKNEPKTGTYYGACTQDGTFSSYLLYVHFGSESFSEYDYLLPDTERCKILEMAWNMPDETIASLEKVANGEWDSYILENVRYLASLGRPVLLRFGAEVNCWHDLAQGKGQDAERKAAAETFIKAFRRVADIAHNNSNNIAMVYSPNDISNWYMSVEDFYPGDKYVDWVGMSSYFEYNAGTSSYGSAADAAYARGKYDSQLAKIKPIIDAFGDRKPIMISECGFKYKGNGQTEAYAAKKLKEFYSYVNMVYPQIKAVFYFNTNDYILYGSETVLKAYNAAVAANEPMSSSLSGNTPVSYCKLENYKQSTSTLKLYTYADCPGDSIKVTYNLNGKDIKSSGEAPYDCTIQGSDLAAAKNALIVKVKLGADSYEFKYTLNVRDGKISVSKYAPIEQPSSWAAAEVNAAIALGIVPPELQENYTKGISRSNLAKLLVSVMAKKSGVSESDFVSTNGADGKFTDTSDKYISAIAGLEIVNGYKQSDGTYKFKPSNTLKRSEMAAVVNRVAKYFGKNTSGYDKEVNFKDTADHWCKSELGWPVHSGVVKGTSATEFSPENTLTTEQTILMAYRLYNSLK